MLTGVRAGSRALADPHARARSGSRAWSCDLVADTACHALSGRWRSVPPVPLASARLAALTADSQARALGVALPEQTRVTPPRSRRLVERGRAARSPLTGVLEPQGR